MALETWHYLNNQFEAGTRGNFKRANVLNNDHLSKLKAENADADIAALEARTEPLSVAYADNYSDWISTKGTYKGHTRLYDGLLEQLSSLKIKQWDIQIQGVHMEGTPDYVMILPNRRKPFQNGGKDERLSQVKSLASRLAPYPALSATHSDVLAFASSMETARDNQQQKEELVSAASDRLEQSRLALTLMMYGNLGVLMDKYREQPEVINNFWQLDLIRNMNQAGGPDDLPDTSVSISGHVSNNMTNSPIVGAMVSIFDSIGGPEAGLVEVFTDSNGNYLIEIDDLPGSYAATLKATMSGFDSSQRNISLSPGTDHLDQNFALNPNQ